MLTVKSAYWLQQQHKHLIPGALSPDDWSRIWYLKIQHRLRLFLWKISANALPLRCKVGRFLTPHDSSSVLCPLCHCAEETAANLFVGCVVLFCGGLVLGQLTLGDFLINQFQLGLSLFCLLGIYLIHLEIPGKILSCLLTLPWILCGLLEIKWSTGRPCLQFQTF